MKHTILMTGAAVAMSLGIAGCTGSVLQNETHQARQCITVKGVKHCYDVNCTIKLNDSDTPAQGDIPEQAN